MKYWKQRFGPNLCLTTRFVFANNKNKHGWIWLYRPDIAKNRKRSLKRHMKQHYRISGWMRCFWGDRD